MAGARLKFRKSSPFRRSRDGRTEFSRERTRARFVPRSIARFRPRGLGYECFRRRGARGKTSGIQSAVSARAGRRKSLCVGLINPEKPTRRTAEFYVSCRMFRCRGGAVPRGGVCKTGEVPARGAARSAAGGRRRRPKAGDAFRGGGTRPVPLTQNLRGGIRHFPRKTSRETRPARPAGGGTNACCGL